MDAITPHGLAALSESITTESARKTDLLAWHARRLEQPAEPDIPLKFQATHRYKATGLYAKVILALKNAGYETEKWGNLTLKGAPVTEPGELNAVNKIQKMALRTDIMLRDYIFTDPTMHITHLLYDIADLNAQRKVMANQLPARLWHPNTLPPPEDFTIPYGMDYSSAPLGHFTARAQKPGITAHKNEQPTAEEYEAALTIRMAQLAALCAIDHASPGAQKAQLRDAQATLEGSTRQR